MSAFLRRSSPRSRHKRPPHALGQLVYEFGRANPRAVFVQVGSGDGLITDPLCFEIAHRRWTGVMVEPVPYLFERLRSNYSEFGRIRFENVAVGVPDGHRLFYYLREAPGDTTIPGWYEALGSFRKDVILQHRVEIPDIEERLVTVEVPCVTFESLCRRNGLTRVDLVQIDAEGYDFEIIESIDLEALHPKLLIFEHYHMNRELYDHCVGHLRSFGFETLAVGMDTVCLHPAALTRRDRRLRKRWAQLRAEPESLAFRSEVRGSEDQPA